GAGGHARVGEVCDLVAQALRADVAADQVGPAREVRLRDHLDDRRGEVRLDLAHVDLAVAGHTHGDDLAVDLHEEVLEGVGGLDAEVGGEGLDGRGVRGRDVLGGGHGGAVHRL